MRSHANVTLRSGHGRRRWRSAMTPAAPRPLPQQSALARWGQRLTAVVALGVLAFVVYTLLEGVV